MEIITQPAPKNETTLWNLSLKTFEEKEGASAELKSLREENKRLREGLSLVAKNIGNGSFALPDASIDFLTKQVPEEVRLVIIQLKNEKRKQTFRNNKI